jgi:hypothetical protein
MPRQPAHRASDREPASPHLTRFESDRLESHGDYVAIDFVELDLAGQDASDARFLETVIADVDVRSDAPTTGS